MSWLKPKGATLLDTLDRWPAEWWLVYRNIEPRGRPTRWLSKWLQPGFQHVQALRRDGRVWVTVYPHVEFVDVHLIREDATPWQLYPGCTIQHVVAMRDHGRMYSAFHAGPWTCTEVVKSLLGVRAFWIRTPYQLYRYLKRHRHEQQPKTAQAHGAGNRTAKPPTRRDGALGR